MTWKVVFYEMEAGESPVWDFIFGLPAKDQAKVVRALDLLEELGLELRGPLREERDGAKGLKWSLMGKKEMTTFVGQWWPSLADKGLVHARLRSNYIVSHCRTFVNRQQ